MVVTETTLQLKQYINPASVGINRIMSLNHIFELAPGFAIGAYENWFYRRSPISAPKKLGGIGDVTWFFKRLVFDSRHRAARCGIGKFILELHSTDLFTKRVSFFVNWIGSKMDNWYYTTFTGIVKNKCFRIFQFCKNGNFGSFEEECSSHFYKIL